ncbi:MAG: Vi polysaccharide biosynthesis UDP-N-acetylglucosamine C-6 dehydrogenase TviB [Pseudomonadota bacterium]|nr:Vi polysaccharide biosynthesis UDP-N-acetylglucosamine C-6 dehydrogenase TviB [Pseudomonadota bacterium]
MNTYKLPALESCNIAIIGLGYVGLPLAVEFGRKRDIVAFDINQKRIKELHSGLDITLEITPKDFSNSSGLRFTTKPKDLHDCNCFIITVPTPINKQKRPDLIPLSKASETVGKVMKKGDIVIYESTVYPGATEGYCANILEKVSGLKFNHDFFMGYSPERINPGDNEHRISNVVKITSGSTPEIAETVDKLYQTIITASTHKVSSIKVAEAAKVIENTQRDVNIALINELALIFNLLEIDTEEVLSAAGTKWNFLPFRPGLVGGHCVGVDPYYLTYKAESVGYKPEIILAGRRLNDGMGAYVASYLIKAMKNKNMLIKGSRILIMGLTFKENCPDIRNTKVTDLIKELTLYGSKVDSYDPWVNPTEVKKEYNINIVQVPDIGVYDAIILAVAHKQIIEMGVEKIRTFGKPQHFLYDLKYIFPSELTDLRL